LLLGGRTRPLRRSSDVKGLGTYFGCDGFGRRYVFVEMEQGLKRMSQLADQLLMLARAEAGAPVGPIGAALKPAINEAIAEIEPLAVAKAISISVTTNGNVQVNAAPHELAILFSNLLDNAVRYTPPGGRVDVRVECANDGAFILAHGAGCGR
jgi:two-component system OmpR family sensor kinase